MFSKTFTLGALTAFLTSASAAGNTAKDKHQNKDANPVIQWMADKYKIVQLTDLHFGESDTADKMTQDFMVNMLLLERPQLVVITGDLCSCAFHGTNSAYFGDVYAKVANIFDILAQNSAYTPFVWVPGASDFESFDGTFENFKAYAATSQWDMTQYNTWKWEQSELHHPFTYDLKVPSADGTDVALRIYMFGTGRFDCLGMGGNDCIRRDAVEWYREESQQIPEGNIYRQNGIAFMHYPLQEVMQMAENKPIHGVKRDYTGCQAINTGLFGEIIQQDTIQAVFAGSDHSSDFYGEFSGKMLGYGRKTGFGSYGPKFQLHGARVLDITVNNETGKMKIDTWIRQEDMSVDKQERENQPSKFSWLKKGHCMGAEEKTDLMSGILNIDGSQTSTEWQKEMDRINQ